LTWAAVRLLLVSSAAKHGDANGSLSFPHAAGAQVVTPVLNASEKTAAYAEQSLVMAWASAWSHACSAVAPGHAVRNVFREAQTDESLGPLPEDVEPPQATRTSATKDAEAAATSGEGKALRMPST
jgi:hypothetical protein